MDPCGRREMRAWSSLVVLVVGVSRTLVCGLRMGNYHIERSFPRPTVSR